MTFHLSDVLADSPLLSPSEAHLVAFTLTSTYVGGLYLSRLSFLHRRGGSNARTKGASTTLPDLVEAEGTHGLDRDDPRVIKSRVKAVSLATIAGIGLVGGIVYSRGKVSDVGDAARSTFSYLGLSVHLPPLPSYPLPNPSTIIHSLLSPNTILNTLYNVPSRFTLLWKTVAPTLLPYTLVPVLYSGSLLVEALERVLPGQLYGRRISPSKRGWSSWFKQEEVRNSKPTTFGGKVGGGGRDDHVLDLFNLFVPSWFKKMLRGGHGDEEVSEVVHKRRWIEMRNYVVGPITEEIVFRSCIISTYLLAGYSKRPDGNGRSFLIYGTPLWFGIAHAHHAYEVYKKGGKTRRALSTALGTAVFQTTYTTLFGWYAAYLYIKTGSILPSIASHVVCNLMGLPDPVGAIESFPSMRGPIIGTYLLGIAGFAYGLVRL